MTQNFPPFPKSRESIRYGSFGEEEEISGTGKVVVKTRSSVALGTIVDMEFILNYQQVIQVRDHYDAEAKSLVKGFLFETITAPEGIALSPGFAWYYESEPTYTDIYADCYRCSVSFLMMPRQGIVQILGGSMPISLSLVGGVAIAEPLVVNGVGVDMTEPAVKQFWELPTGIELLYAESAQPRVFGAVGVDLAGGQPSTGGGDPNLSMRKLILHFNGGEGAGIVDSSPYARTVIAYGDAALTSVNKKYGSSGLRNPGTTGSKIAFTIPGGLGAGAFCVEWYEYLYTILEYDIMFNSRLSPETSALGLDIRQDGRVSTMNLWIFGDSIPSPSKTLNQWSHNAIVRREDGVMIRFYKGQQTGISSAPITNNFSAPNFEFSGTHGLFSVFPQGDYDELRVTVGDPVYTTTFDPPGPHPDS